MKVLFSCGVPFFLAHGGSQTLTEELMRGLESLGVEVEPARWWDGAQTGDILHFIGRPALLNVRLAQAKGFKVVMTDLLDQTASRGPVRLFAQRTFRQLFGGLLGRVTTRLDWQVFRELDAIVYAVPHEWEVAKYLFAADSARGVVIPHGLEPSVLQELAEPQAEEDYLVSVATIDPRKNSLLLAQAAHFAKVPIVFLGKPYSEEDAYFRRFRDLVDDCYVRYAGFVSAAEKYRYLRGARGFVLLSRFESGCIAVFEAAAAGLPLLLPSLPWAMKSYPAANDIAFVSLAGPESIAAALSRFYERAHRLPAANFPILNWREVSQKYLEIYQRLLAHTSVL